MELQAENKPDDISRREAIKRRWAKGWNTLRGLNNAINQSTFGRVFRLRGSGHVNIFSTPVDLEPQLI
jgi:AGZA family xanthine/uracil permease-like MFS transporter